ncbi:hypothetical protein ACLBXM_18945 [Xanthobacteraceae bacterium A53D]
MTALAPAMGDRTDTAWTSTLTPPAVDGFYRVRHTGCFDYGETGEFEGGVWHLNAYFIEPARGLLFFEPDQWAPLAATGGAS